MLKSLNLLICCIMSSLEQEQQQEILHLCLTGFTLRKPVKIELLANATKKFCPEDGGHIIISSSLSRNIRTWAIFLPLERLMWVTPKVTFGLESFVESRSILRVTHLWTQLVVFGSLGPPSVDILFIHPVSPVDSWTLSVVFGSWAVYLLNTLYKLLPGCFQRNLGCFLE